MKSQRGEEIDEGALTRAIGNLGEAVVELRRETASGGWNTVPAHKAILDVERAMLLWRIRRREILGLAGRTPEISDLEAAIVALVEGS